MQVLQVKATSDGTEWTRIAVTNGSLSVTDATGNQEGDMQQAVTPTLVTSEPHTLRVFVDKGVIESTLDSKTSITFLSYPKRPDQAIYAAIIGEPASCQVTTVEVWGMTGIFD